MRHHVTRGEFEVALKTMQERIDHAQDTMPVHLQSEE